MTVRWVLAAFLASILLFAPGAQAQEEPAAEPEGSSDEAPMDSDGAEESGESPGLNRELRTVEEEVNNLKERVFRSKATLQLLKELVVEGATGGSRVILRHVNELPSNYTIESIQYFLDGKNVYTKVDPGGQLSGVKEMKVHEQGLPPGTHTLQVKMVMRGNGSGVFSYLRTYQFNVQSSYSFNVEGGRVTRLSVVAGSRGGLRNFTDRPAITYEERSATIREE